MTSYENLVMQTQLNYSRYYSVYAHGGTPYRLSHTMKPSYEEQIENFAHKVEAADCILVGGASGLSASRGGDFYYSDNDSYRKYFGPFAEKHGFKGAFDGMQYNFPTRNEYWGYLTTFLYTTLSAPIRKPYLDLDRILKGKDFHILTTNQDTQFVKLYPESIVSEIQGDHRFFQCSECCSDHTWDSTEHIMRMKEAMGCGTEVPDELIPHCPYCGREAFPWVRGYGNFLEGEKYQEEYQKVSSWLESHADRKILFIELGVGRLTPMFIQEPFWNLTYSLPNAEYVSVNDRYDFLPVEIENKGMVIIEDIAKVLSDTADYLEERDV